MNNKTLFVGDVGVLFKVYAGIDLSDATSIEFDVKKPNGLIVSWTATMASDNNYYAEYTSVANDLNVEGDYKLSIQFTMVGGKVFTGSTGEFSVYKQFEDSVTFPRSVV